MPTKPRQPPRKKPGRVSLPPVVAPPKGSPFAGISGTKAPARNTQIPNLTEHVQVARDRVQALKHAGLRTEAEREATTQAQAILAKSKPLSKPFAPKSGGKPSPAPPDKLPARLSRPAVSLDKTPPSAPTPTVPSRLPNGSRGALSPRAASILSGPPKGTGGIDFGFVTDPAKRLAKGVLNDPLGAELRLLAPSAPQPKGTNITALTAKKGNEAAAKAYGLGAQGVGKVPTTFDVVAPAGAASFKPVTKDELAQLEAKGYDLAPRLRKKFTANALRNGWNPAEIDGISGSALIDKAFTKPAPLPLRIAANFAGGVAKLGTLPAGLEGAARETIAGRGGQVAQALGEGLISELPIVGKHKTTDTAVADPFGFITQFAGAGKTVGVAGKLGRAGTAAERVVNTASSGLKVERGALSKNAYTATGQLASDKAAARVPAIGRRLEAEVVDKAVRRTTNKHSPAFVKVQRAYKAALDKTGHKRAAELQGYQAAGGKPEQLAAFYRAQGEKGPADFFTKVAQNTKTLDAKDKAFLDTHAALAKHTGDTLISTGKFGDTAAKFRAYSPLIRSAGRLGDPEAQRILALRDEYITGFDVMPEQDVAALRGAIDQSIDDFATKHAASGGTEPTRVAYSQPKPLIASPFQPGPGAPTGFKTPRGKQKAETGATFESGKYLIDPNSPLVVCVRAQRQHLASVLDLDVSAALGKHLTAGDPIPPGHVFVSETNLRGLRRTTNDLADNPVSSPDYYAEEAGMKQRIFDQLSANSTPSGQRVPRGEKGYAIPEGAWKRILDHTRPASRNAYDRFLNQYQRILISYRPSTIVNNTAGSIPLAMTAGAGPKSFKQAFQAMRDPTLAPAVLRGHGVAGSLAPGVRSKVGVGFDFMRAQSARGEDFSRLATYFAKAGPAIKKRASELQMSADDYQRALAAGDVDPKLLDTFLDHAEKFVGDVAKPNGKIARQFGRVILFHNWVGHIAKLLLYTLPVKHPRRLAILNDLSDYGDQYRQEHGVWPDWYASYLPLFQSIKRVGHGQKPQVFTKAFSTQGINPYSTLNNFAAPVSTSESAANILFGLSNPILSTAGKAIFARPYDSHSLPRYIAGQIGRQIPGVPVVRPQGGMGPDSIPFLAEERKKYSSGHKINGKTTYLPWDMRPGARAQPGILGGLERYLLGGFYDVPAQGPVHSKDQKKHIGAVAKASRKG